MNSLLLSFNELAVEIPVIIFIVLLVGGVIAWQAVKRVRAKKRGGGGKSSSCGCGCSGCAMAGTCQSATNKKSDDDGMPDIPVQSTVTCDFSDLVK